MDLKRLLVLLLTLIHQSKSRIQVKKKIVCYMSQGPNPQYRLQASDIDATLCTHIVYEANMPYLLPPHGESNELVKLKQENPDLKLMVSVGGWMEGSFRFSRISLNAERRRRFAEYICKKLREIEFDGVDLNWQWPGLRAGSSQDKANYAALVEELKKYFEDEGQKTGQSPLIISVVLPPFKEFLLNGYDLVKIKRYADFLNLLTMDYHMSIESCVAHPAPLYTSPKSNFNDKLSVDNTVQEYLDLGIDRGLLNLGIALYGRSYILQSSRHTSLGSRAVAPGVPGFVTRICGVLAYFEICRHNKDDGWTIEYPNSTAMGPISYHGQDWVAYDDAETVKKKVRYAKEKDLGGVMVWSIDLDDFKGYCNESFPMMKAVKEAMGSVEIIRDNPKLRTNSDTNKNSANGTFIESTVKNKNNPESTTNTNTYENTPSDSTNDVVPSFTEPTVVKQRTLEPALNTNNRNIPRHTSTRPSILVQKNPESADANNDGNTPRHESFPTTNLLSTTTTIPKQRNLDVEIEINTKGNIPSHTSTQPTIPQRNLETTPNNNDGNASQASTQSTILKQRNLETATNDNKDGNTIPTSTESIRKQNDVISTNTVITNIKAGFTTQPTPEKKKLVVTTIANSNQTNSTQKSALPTININASLFHYVGTPSSKPIVIHTKNHTYKFQANQSFNYKNLWVQYNINCSDVC